jgi:alanine racemase
MSFIDFLRQIKRKFSPHQPLIEVRVFGENLLHNLAEFKNNYPQLEFAPVLKSNAYGHGIIGVAKILDQEKAPFFCADSFFEARQLRHEGIKTKILIIGFVRSEEILSSRLKNVAFAITRLEQLQQLNDLTPTLSFVRRGGLIIHLKIDTGMHRQGILLNEIDTAIKIIKENKNIILEGVCSHLADADNIDEKFTLEQIKKWNDTAKIFAKNFGGIKYFHLSASAGVAFADKIDANIARLGIGLYGIKTQNSISKTQGFGVSPAGDTKIINLKPTLEMKTIITSVKEIEPGEKIGYGVTFTAEKKMKIATVPAGYFEGIDRRLSNLGFVKVKTCHASGVINFCPIIGRVSMNITTIDVSKVEDIKIGDEVILISSNSGDKNSVENTAKICNTIPYEILAHIPAHLRRMFF